MALPEIYPIHGMLLVRDLQDPTLGGLLDASQSADDIGAIRGLVVRAGEGFVTKDGIIPLATKEGDEIIFLREHAIPFASFPDFYYLISESMTDGVLNRDPYADEIPEFKGIDIDKLMDQIDLESKIRRDPDHSDTQD